ncbi:MAG: AAA family ATPase [Acidobacteriota bacterium]|nr:AAA family ATPase [Acidobacteriota bacterium]
MAATLAAVLDSRDAARFVGRAGELARLDALLAGGEPGVVLLHGPAGLGKSTLMRELSRRARCQGFEPIALDGRDLAPLADELRRAIEPAMACEKPLVLLDSWERLAALDGYLRVEILPRLPAGAAVVIASRRRPGSAWCRDGWENLALEVALKPLADAEADALLLARGLEDPAQRQACAVWAGGSPLALALLADAGGLPAGVGDSDAPPGVVDGLLVRLLDAQPEGDERRVLSVAALAHVTDPALLAATLPDLDAERAFELLREHPSAEPFGEGVMLHDLVSRALRADLRRRSPEMERELRRRLADALYARAARGGFVQFTRDLQHLVRDPAIRWGFAWDASGHHRVDAPRPGDLERIAARSGRAALRWLASAERYFREAPDRVSVVRDADDAVAGYGVAVTPANLPSFASDDPLLGPRTRHAREHFAGRAVVCRQAIDLTRGRSSPVTALIGMASVVGSGLENPAAAYLPIARGDVASQAFSRACGAVAVPELAVEHEGVAVECHVLDYGPGGLLANQRAAVYRELGLPPPPPPPPPPTTAAVRQALRDYRSPALLACCPLASAAPTAAARAELARDRIDEAVREAFGSTAGEQRMRRVLVRGYLDPAPSHEVAAEELNMSRTTYFRILRAAVEHVAASLGVQGEGRGAGSR